MDQQRLQVFLTVDTETAEERVYRGKICPPVGYEERVWGRFRGRAREYGLAPLMSELERYGFRATFFVEALAHRYFGMHALSEVCSQTRGRGHDVQLHLHPNYRRMEWRRAGMAPLPSLFGTYPLAEQLEMLEEGLDALVRCGVPRSSLIAFRAGDYAASETTWEALRHCGLHIDSSYNLCHRNHGCQVAHLAEHSGPFEVSFDLVEFPITSIREASGRHRHLQLSAVSLSEMIHTLRTARAHGLRAVTLVTHPFELFHTDPQDPSRGWENRITWRRLRGLLAFLNSNRADFEVSTLGELTMAAAGALCRPEAPMPSGSRLLRQCRMLEQALQAATRYKELACGH